MSIMEVDPRHVMSCGIFYSLVIGSTSLSNLYLASFSIDQSLLILSPTRSRLLLTRRHTRNRLLGILFVLFIFMIPHHFYYVYNPQSTLFVCEFYPVVKAWKIRVLPLLHALLFVSLPSIITCASSIILLHNRCHHRKIIRNQLSSLARRLERNSILIFFVSTAILFTLIPTAALQMLILYDGLAEAPEPCSVRRKVYRILVNCAFTLAALNYSSKFYVRLLMSSSFRRDFIRLVCCNRLSTTEKNDLRSASLIARHRREGSTSR